MAGVRETSDLSQWSVEDLKNLDEFLTRNRYAYDENNESLYIAKGKEPAFNLGSRNISLNGVVRSINRWSFIHFVKERKAIRPFDAKRIYEPIAITARNNRLSAATTTFDRKFEQTLAIINSPDSNLNYRELIKAISECKSVYKIDEVGLSKYREILNMNYYVNWYQMIDYSIKDNVIRIKMKKCNHREVCDFIYTSQTKVNEKYEAMFRSIVDDEIILKSAVRARGLGPDAGITYFHIDKNTIGSFRKDEV